MIRNFSIQKQEDQAQDLMDMDEGLLAVPKAETEGSLEIGETSREGSREGSRTAAREQSAPTQSYFKEQGGYGEVVTGRNQFCKAAMVIDYVIYSAKEIK